eukprot:CAMPEP_0119219924 /NCGR_PEP_ID=MMETSP1327-20130426/24544_1 /TAXON_ID=38833 /ORGANISM="Micromonas pusilla, Strain RCC2306" /LENGTH=140 /DNA_ID=CAMNT_0007218017 /DNA_START=120 /DNA_END=538 /DNA_ORIENTATION=-
MWCVSSNSSSSPYVSSASASTENSLLNESPAPSSKAITSLRPFELEGAEPPLDEPGRADVGRADAGRALPGRAMPGRADAGRAPDSPLLSAYRPSKLCALAKESARGSRASSSDDALPPPSSPNGFKGVAVSMPLLVPDA